METNGIVGVVVGGGAGPWRRALKMPFSMISSGCPQFFNHLFRSLRLFSIVSGSDVNTMIVLARQYAMLFFT